MPDVLSIDEFLDRARHLPVLDVRTPSEFAAGHIPGARSLPLFSDEERAEIGTAYAREGRATAVRIGLRHVGPRLDLLAAQLLDADPAGHGLLLHCWRGGMRSGSVAWLAGTLGRQAATLAGGYKSFRRKALELFARDHDFRVIAGLTGTGKTAVLRELARRGEAVVDLEALARHKGSAFGDLGEEPQPTQEQFENDLASVLLDLPPGKRVWIEDESRTVGRLVVPPDLWNRKRSSLFHVIDLPVAARVAQLRAVYEVFPADELARRIDSIRRRLGGDRTNRALAAMADGDTTTACGFLLSYYDRTYGDSLAALPPDRVFTHSFETCDPVAIADSMLQAP